MSKYARSTAGSGTTVNNMGAVAYKQSAKEELAFAVLASFIENSYYEGKEKRIDRIGELVKQVAGRDPLFVAKLAVVTRREFHMRSSSQALIAELSRVHRGDSLVQQAIVELAERPDDLTEIAAYLNGPLPNQVKKGIARALPKFDAYQLAKYRSEGKDWSLVDLFNLTHPQTKDRKLQKAWKSLIAGTLKNTDTFEAKLSAGESKSEVFSELLREGRLGYMACLRNLRNILETGDMDLIRRAAALIRDPDQVRKSKQLPFRFLSAYEAIGTPDKRYKGGLRFENDGDGAEILTSALNDALTVSCQNIPLLHGKTAILTDNSGSMRGDHGGSSVLSAHSSRTTSDIANLFAAMYWTRADNTFIGVFGDQLKQPVPDRDGSLFDTFDLINRTGGTVGASTEEGAFVAFEEMLKARQKVDRVIMFTDCELGRGLYGIYHGSPSQGIATLVNEYRKFNPDFIFYCVNLRGNGTTVMKDGQVAIAGWSDKIFELLETIERKEGLVKYIQNYPAFNQQ